MLRASKQIVMFLVADLAQRTDKRFSKRLAKLFRIVIMYNAEDSFGLKFYALGVRRRARNHGRFIAKS